MPCEFWRGWCTHSGTCLGGTDGIGQPCSAANAGQAPASKLRVWGRRGRPRALGMKISSRCYTAVAIAISLATGVAAYSLRVLFEEMYEGATLTAIAELTIKHSAITYFLVLPLGMALIAGAAWRAEREDFGALICNIIALVGVACLAYGLHYTINRTTFRIGDTSPSRSAQPSAAANRR